MNFTQGFARARNECLPVILLLFASALGSTAHAQASSTGVTERDTLPLSVARASLDAYDRHDVAALIASYDTLVVHEMLGDSSKRMTATPQQAWAGIADYFAKNKVHAELKQQIVSGPFVVFLYDFIENDKRTPHIDIYEVRHGKIVHEWDQP
jgi:hypothetical protein